MRLDRELRLGLTVRQVDARISDEPVLKAHFRRVCGLLGYAEHAIGV